jgi:hypothetical protein
MAAAVSMQEALSAPRIATAIARGLNKICVHVLVVARPTARRERSSPTAHRAQMQPALHDVQAGDR